MAGADDVGLETLLELNGLVYRLDKGYWVKFEARRVVEWCMTHASIKIGIMSRDEFKRHTLAIARGEIRPAADEPKIWFESLQSFAQVLNDDNRLLLHIIAEQQPRSLGALEALTGRKKSNLSRTLRTLAGYGIVELVRQPNRELTPQVKATRFQLEIGLPERCVHCGGAA